MSQEVSPFPAGDHKAAMNEKHKTQKTQMIHKRSATLERSLAHR